MKKSSQRKLVAVIAAIIVFVALPTHAAPRLKQEYPRLVNYYLAWTLNEQEAKELAQWDVLVLDMEVARHNPTSLKRIREINPSAVLLAYITPAEIRTDLSNLENAAPMRTTLASRIPEQWYLKNAAGDRRSFWPGTAILNVAEVGPVINGVHWTDTLVSFVKNDIMGTGLWDGVFYDNAWDNISYFANGPVDLDANGENEVLARSDELWRAGLKSLYKKTRTALPNAYVFANDGPLYASEVDGMLIENFAKERWSIMVRKLQKVRDESRERAAMLNANTNNTGNPANYQAMRYGLTTAVAYDSFYSFDSGDQTHAERWWYDEYKAFLGLPRGKPQTLANGLVRRDFEQGIVLINPSSVPQKARFVEEFEKIIGVQDKSVNDGSVSSVITVPASDGIVLLRRISEIVGVPYENGSFARVFNSGGAVERAGFFAMNKRLSDGEITAVADLDGDGALERITASGKSITIGAKTVQPFGSAFTGTLTFAIADMNGDGRKEVLVAASTAGNGEVRIYGGSGVLAALPFGAFGQKYRGGVSIAAADLNNDGKAEIIVGAGPGGGPEVRIFNGTGKLLAPGFFAFDPRFKGGVRVAAGKVLPGNSVQIVVGAGVGGGPQVRLFDGKGRSMSAGFFAFDRTRRTGVTPAVADIDGDGVNEILAFTRDFNVP